MNDSRAYAAFIAALALVGPAPLMAQACSGFPELKSARFRLDASAAAYTYATAIGTSLTVGKDVFATAGIGRTRDAELDASTVDLSLDAGIELAAKGNRRVSLCPLVTASMAFGPYDFVLDRTDYRYTAGGIGVRVGGIAVRTRAAVIIPAADLRVIRLAVQQTKTGAEETFRRKRSDTYWMLTLGIGMSLNDLIVIRPAVSIPYGLVDAQDRDAYAVPFGREEAEISLGITAGINFRRRGQ